MTWIDVEYCFINLERVDYISFEKLNDVWQATVCFENGESLSFEHKDISKLKNYFKKAIENE